MGGHVVPLVWTIKRWIVGKMGAKRRMINAKIQFAVNTTRFNNISSLPCSLPQRFRRISLHFEPHCASVDFADRMTIDTRDYNYEYGSQIGKLAVMQTYIPLLVIPSLKTSKRFS